MERDHLVLYEEVLPPSAEWDMRSPGWGFVRVRSGDGYLLAPNQLHPIGSGDVLVCAPAASCTIRASLLAELRLQCFQILPDLLAGVLSAYERQRLAAINTASHNSVRRFCHDTPIAHSFTKLAQPAPTPLQSRCQMLEMAASILGGYLPKEEPKPPRVPTAAERFGQIFRRMPEAELRYRTPEELARLCGCGVRHFSRLFREHFGYSFTPKKTELRLQKAQELLVGTDSKIIDVAMDSGFQHVGLFASLFKKRYGVTPSAWRKRRGQCHRETTAVRHHQHVKMLLLMVGLGTVMAAPVKKLGLSRSTWRVRANVQDSCPVPSGS